MSNQDENTNIRTSSDKIQNFNQYESHLDNIINQYKSQSIKCIRENRKENHFSSDNASGILNKNFIKKDTIVNSKDTTPSKDYNSDIKFDFFKGGNFTNLSKLNFNNNNGDSEKRLNKSRDKDSHTGDDYIKISKNIAPKNYESDILNQTSKNFNNDSKDDNFHALKITDRNKFKSEDNIKYEHRDKEDDRACDKKLEFNYNYKNEANNKNYKKDHKEENSTKFNTLCELKDRHFNRKNSYRDDYNEKIDNKYSKRGDYTNRLNNNSSDKYSPEYNRNIDYNDTSSKNEYEETKYKDKYQEPLKYKYDLSDKEQDKREITVKDTYRNKYDRDVDFRENRNKDRSLISKNYEYKNDDSIYKEKRDDSYTIKNEYSKYSKYDKYETFDREKNDADGKDAQKPKAFESSGYSKRDHENYNEPEKYKFKSLERKSEANHPDDLLEENRRLLNQNTSLSLKNKNLENDLNNYVEKYKKLESEIESANEKLSEMENHYLSMLKEKDETISNLNSRITQLEKEDVKNINIRIALFKNLKLFFLNNLKFLKMSEENKKEYEDALNSDNIDSINFNVCNKVLGSFDFFISELVNENKDLKEGFDIFDKKIKKYEKDHIEKLKRNEEIIEDLKTENNILKKQIEGKNGSSRYYSENPNHSEAKKKPKKKSSHNTIDNPVRNYSNSNSFVETERKQNSNKHKNNVLDETNQSISRDPYQENGPSKKYSSNLNENSFDSNYKNSDDHRRRTGNDFSKKSKTRDPSKHSSKNSAFIEEHSNNKYEKYSRYTGYEEFSKTERRDYNRNREKLHEERGSNYERADRDREDYDKNYSKYDENFDSKFIQASKLTPSRNKKNEFNNSNYNSKYNNFKNTEGLDENFTNERNPKNLFEMPVLITPKNFDNKNSDKFSTNTFSTIKNRDYNNFDYSADSLNNTNMIGYNPLKINEVSNNNEKMNSIKNKINNDLSSNTRSNNLDSKSPNRRFDETSVNNDFKMLDNLKNKIKDLESKIGEINNDDKEKKIIDSLREYRAKNMTSL